MFVAKHAHDQGRARTPPERPTTVMMHSNVGRKPPDLASGRPGRTLSRLPILLAAVSCLFMPLPVEAGVIQADEMLDNRIRHLQNRIDTCRSDGSADADQRFRTCYEFCRREFAEAANRRAERAGRKYPRIGGAIPRPDTCAEQCKQGDLCDAIRAAQDRLDNERFDADKRRDADRAGKSASRWDLAGRLLRGAAAGLLVVFAVILGAAISAAVAPAAAGVAAVTLAYWAAGTLILGAAAGAAGIWSGWKADQILPGDERK